MSTTAAWFCLSAQPLTEAVEAAMIIEAQPELFKASKANLANML